MTCEQNETDAVIIRAVNMILVEGLRLGATEIELSPAEGTATLRYKTPSEDIDGEAPSLDDYPVVVRRIKVMCDLPPQESQTPQSGKFFIKALSKEVDINVTITPGPHGASVVMEILPRNRQP